MPLQSYRIVDNIPGKEVWMVVVEDWDDQLLKQLGVRQKHIDKLERKHYDSVKDAKQALRKMFSGRGGVVKFKGKGRPNRPWKAVGDGRLMEDGEFMADGIISMRKLMPPPYKT